MDVLNIYKLIVDTIFLLCWNYFCALSIEVLKCFGCQYCDQTTPVLKYSACYTG